MTDLVANVEDLLADPFDRGFPSEPKWSYAPSAEPLRRAAWVNWAGSQVATPDLTIAPANEAEVIEAVRFALRERLNLRPMGGGFSFSPLVPTSGVVLDTRRMSGVVSVDHETSRVRVLPGTQIISLSDQLWEKGISLSISGIWDLQTIVGALSTGTHGSARDLGCMASFITKVRLVDGRGEVVEIGQDAVRELAAARVSLGLLGVITEVEIQAEPRFLLNRIAGYPLWDDVMASMEADLTGHPFYSAMWFPHHESPAQIVLPTPEGMNMADRAWVQTFDKVEYDPSLDNTDRTWGEGIGRSYHVLTVDHPAMPAFHEMELCVPVEQAMEALGSLRKLLTAKDDAAPLFLRWVKGDDSMISPFADRDGVMFDITAKPGTDYWPLFQEFHNTLAPFGARPHWGKIHVFNRSELERVLPRHGEFVEVRRQFDPTGIFLNDHTRSLFE